MYGCVCMLAAGPPAAAVAVGGQSVGGSRQLKKRS